jgi:phosphoenolpyruvate carboxykinase (GTP)
MVNQALKDWVGEVARWTRPERIVWCDGSEFENRSLLRTMVSAGSLIELNQGQYPGCYLHRSDPCDVARTEHLTFICCEREEDAGPTNNWMPPAEARRKLGKLLSGAMKGRNLYVVPYLMGPEGARHARVGVEITDSEYVVASMRIMTRMGQPAMKALGDSSSFVKGLHSLGDLHPERRFICHFPESREIWSIGSGYGGNALLGKKCFALRIGSVLGRDEGWLAEHMLILGVENPRGETRYLAAAFPSACGKTNLAMLVPPPSQKGYKVWTVGDDIAWLWIDGEGRLRAINPECGFFGVAPGTSGKTNRNAMETIRRNTLFTNVAVTPDGLPWWEGMGPPPSRLIDWRGREWSAASGEKAAHPNSRFTASLLQCPSISPRWDDPEGVPISAIVFGGRRAGVVPLVFEAFDWAHGVYIGASMASETTAAAEGDVGRVRRDPMAMLPFCGYHLGAYVAHWLAMGKRLARPPPIFQVNWFRRDRRGEYLWPGFGENLRVLRWILDRAGGQAAPQESPVGWLPAPGALDVTGLDLPPERLEELLAIDREGWRREIEEQAEFFQKLGRRLPPEIWREHQAARERLSE